MYKVPSSVLDRIKKHLKAVQPEIEKRKDPLRCHTIAQIEAMQKFKKETEDLITLIEDNYPG